MIFVSEELEDVKGLKPEDWFAVGMSLALLALAALFLAFGWA